MALPLGGGLDMSKDGLIFSGLWWNVSWLVPALVVAIPSGLSVFYTCGFAETLIRRTVMDFDMPIQIW